MLEVTVHASSGMIEVQFLLIRIFYAGSKALVVYRPFAFEDHTVVMLYRYRYIGQDVTADFAPCVESRGAKAGTLVASAGNS